MRLLRRQILQFGAAFAVVPALPGRGGAEQYPSHPVRILVGFPAGGVGDMIARLVGQWLADRSGQPFVVDNRAGAAGNIAAETVSRAAPDGYTLLFVGVNHAINATMYEKLNFSIMRDFAPIASLVRVPNLVVVHPSVPADTLPAFITYAKSIPGRINMGSAGNGTSAHLAGELFKMMAGVDLVHVPYRGGAPAVADLLGNHVQVYFGPISETIENVRAGRLRALAVTTSSRLDALPRIPTVAETVPDYEASGWQGIAAPKNTSSEIIDALNKSINAGLSDSNITSRLAQLKASPLVGSPGDFANFIAAEIEKWGNVVRAANIQPA